jgi:Fe-S oxidoreductase
MLTLTEKILFILLAGGMSWLAWQSFSRMFRIIGRGQGPDTIPFDEIPRRLATLVISLFNQGRILRNRTISSLFHYGIAWGFIFYGLVNVVDLLEGFLPTSWHLWSAANNFWWGNLFRLLADILTISVLAGVLYFLLRRFVVRDPVLKIRDNVKQMPAVRAGGISQDSLIVGLFILIHVGARYTSVSAHIAKSGADLWQPFGSLYAALLGSGGFLNAATFNALHHLGWWLALGTILLFLPYFPYTKHAHLFMGPINFATRPERGALGAMHAVSFEDESNEKFGVKTLTDLSQTQILDAFACIMCNRCQEACPAYNTGKELSPAALEINKRYFIRENFVDLANGGEDTIPLLDYAISESAVWACTSCGACNEVCPVGNEPLHDIMELRRAQVLMEDSYPHELTNAFQGIERRGNPWGATNSRLEWAQSLPFAVPTVDQNPDFEYLFWVGCAGAFDPDAQRVARAVATILNAAGVSYAVLGTQESCTGDAARRAGNEYLFHEMATQNIELLDSYEVNTRRIVTSCPHCLTTLGVEYRELGGHYKVYHHTQLIADLIGRGKLRLNENRLEHITFHDPCFLGRHNGIYDDPRRALELAGATLLEMDLNRADGFCCGAGGAQVWKEEEHGTATVNETRYKQAEATGAKTVAVGCPFCAVMLNDARGKHGQSMEVKDVAQIIAERLES